MKKILYIIAWVDSLGELQTHQKFFPYQEACELSSKDIKKIMLTDYTGDVDGDSFPSIYKVSLKQAIEQPPEYYALVVEGDVEPRLSGPFESDVQRDQEAGSIKMENEEDGVYAVNVVDRMVAVQSYSGNEMDQLKQEALDWRERAKGLAS